MTRFDARIFGIAFVTILTATTSWAKPKNAVEYTPFKSENPNASVYECECLPGYHYGFEVSYDIRDYNSYKLFEWTSIVVHGWEKKKGGWEKLMEYKPKDGRDFFGRVRGNGTNKYTHYAVEFEAPEYSNSLRISATGKTRGYTFDSPYMEINLSISEEYKKLIGEKRAAEEAERKAKEDRLAKEELFNKYKAADAELRKKSKGYEFHGISEYYRTYRLLKGKSLTNGHAYVSKLTFSNDFSRAEFYEKELMYNNYINSYKGSVHLQYANNTLREQIVLLKINYNDEVWFCYTPNSSGDITILGFTVTKGHSFFYDASENNLKLYAEWQSQRN